jgi:hypothetical protein
VLFSIGSALRVLARSGIAPDFHVELETAPSTRDLLNEIADAELLGRLTLLASSGIAPGVARLFGNSRLFVRENSLSSMLLGKDANAVPGCFPVVGNAALGIATSLGFRRVTLFGIDFGYRDPERHHAAGTVYISEESGRARNLADVGLGHLDILNLNYADTRHRLVSIAGDELLAEDVLRTSHAMMENFLPGFPDLRLRQCGTGARIRGAENLLPEHFDCSAYRGDPAAILAEIDSRFEQPPLTFGEYARRMAALAGGFEQLMRPLQRLFERDCANTSAYAALVSEAWELVLDARGEGSALPGLVTGIFTSYFKATIERSFMTASEAELRRFLALAQRHFVALLADISSALEPFRSAVDPTLASRHIAS